MISLSKAIDKRWNETKGDQSLHGEIPKKDDRNGQHFGDQIVKMKTADELGEQELVPEKPERGNDEKRGILITDTRGTDAEGPLAVPVKVPSDVADKGDGVSQKKMQCEI